MDNTEQLAIEVQRSVAQALAEDVGRGDLTAQLIDAGRHARGAVVSREDAVLCGTAWFDAAFKILNPASRIEWARQDGDQVGAGDLLCVVDADARTLLTAERTALNFLQLLSATATQTRRFVQAVAGTRAKIVDTRKTLP
ncbi:MAG: nicotinate-nucleotide diphosphorylase (carboxylating), partial [Rhodocyclaceae bacterium]|nr:nicotinate-nucleotide diphosphorylase (carboxylating) [Rhodocyclaceae bacterium]